MYSIVICTQILNIFFLSLQKSKMKRRPAIRFRAAHILFLCSLGAVLLQPAYAQSNYASHANNIGYRGEGLPEEATLDGKVSVLDQFKIVCLVRTERIVIRLRRRESINTGCTQFISPGGSLNKKLN